MPSNYEKYKPSPEKSLEYTRRYHKKLKNTILNAYGGCCSICLESQKEFLCITKKNGGGNQERQKMGGADKLYRWIRANDFPTNFRLLCHNCNFSICQYGYCPHQGKKD
jgi:hypothetical protein